MKLRSPPRDSDFSGIPVVLANQRVIGLFRDRCFANSPLATLSPCCDRGDCSPRTSRDVLEASTTWIDGESRVPGDDR